MTRATFGIAVLLLLALSNSQRSEASRSLAQDSTSNGNVQPPCRCPKILRPVCYENGDHVANNWCIAVQCMHIPASKVSECRQIKQQQEAEEHTEEPLAEHIVACTLEFDPQCTEDGTMVGSNPCKAAQNQKFKGIPFKNEWCNNARDNTVTLSIPLVVPKRAEPKEENEQERQNSPVMCTMEFNPQCTEDGTMVGSNPCKAAQNQKFKGTPFKNEWCNTARDNTVTLSIPLVVPERAEPKKENEQERQNSPVMCTMEFNPQCTEDGTMVGYNPCKAAQNQKFKGVLYKNEWCYNPKDSTKTLSVPLDSKPVEPKEEDEQQRQNTPVMCTMEFDPQCTEDGTMVGYNPCKAAQNQKFKGVLYKNEWCSSSRTVSMKVPVTVMKVPAAVSTTAPIPEEKARDEGSMVICTAEFDPQCTEGGIRVGSNPCKAAQNQKFKGVPYKSEWCSSGRTMSMKVPVTAMKVPAVANKPETVAAEEPWECDDDYDPLCFEDGTMAGSNECYAEHNPAANASYKREWCPDYVAKEDEEPAVTSTCLCPLVWNPYCDDSGEVKADNACDAKCKGFDLSTLSVEWCNINNVNGREVSSPSTAEPEGDDTEHVTFSSRIKVKPAARTEDEIIIEEAPAAQLLIEDTETDGEIHSRMPPNGRSIPQVCVCPLVFDPVCTEDGTVAGDNGCDAECNNHPRGTYHRDWCNTAPRTDNVMSRPAPVDTDLAPIPEEDITTSFSAELNEEDGLCKCPKGKNRPVCSRNGTLVADNRCMGECLGLMPGIDFQRSWCPQADTSRDGGDDIGLAQCSHCPEEWEPVCYADDLSYVSANACYANCYNHADPKRQLVSCP